MLNQQGKKLYIHRGVIRVPQEHSLEGILSMFEHGNWKRELVSDAVT